MNTIDRDHIYPCFTLRSRSRRPLSVVRLLRTHLSVILSKMHAYEITLYLRVL